MHFYHIFASIEVNIVVLALVGKEREPVSEITKKFICEDTSNVAKEFICEDISNLRKIEFILRISQMLQRNKMWFTSFIGKANASQ